MTTTADPRSADPTSPDSTSPDPATGQLATAGEVLVSVTKLGPTISSRASEVEAARRLPSDLLAALAKTGCFRLLLPPSHGGLGADLPSAMRVFEALARADASVGWTVAIGASSWCDVAGLPRDTFDSLYDRPGDTYFAGAFNPTGVSERTDSGYRVNGRWSFASGCEHSHWMFGNTIEAVDGDHRMRMVVFAPSEVVIEDTWHVSGLCGTGSHHFHADDVLVPAERTFLMMAHPPSLDIPLLRIPPPTLYSMEVATIALGVAQGAIDEIVSIASDKVPLLAGTALAENPLFQNQLAGADADLRAVRALLYEDAAVAWSSAVAEIPLAPEQRARIRSAGVRATERAVSVVEMAYRAGGGTSLYSASPLQRRLRDVNAVSQHFLVRPDTLTTAGAVLAGLEPDLTIF